MIALSRKKGTPKHFAHTNTAKGSEGTLGSEDGHVKIVDGVRGLESVHESETKIKLR